MPLAPLAPGSGVQPASVPIAVDELSAPGPVGLSANIDPALGGNIVAGNVGISIPPGALQDAGSAVTISVQTGPALAAPGGPVQFSGNGTVLDISFRDAAGNPITVFPAPITLTLRYNAADVGQANGASGMLSAAYVIDADSPPLENPMGFPAGTFVLFAPSNVQTDGSTVSVTTQALGSPVAVVTNGTGWVQTLKPNTPELSSFAADAVVFGRKPQFSYLQVMEPQIGSRLLVLDPDTQNYCYVNAVDVGPSGPPPSVTARGVVSELLNS